jgi:broad specificity phosphatase PhoE
MPTPPIYFLRHGETDWNAAGKLQGRTDIALNAKGRSQAKRNGGMLSELIDDPALFRYVASPLLRTRQTMQIARACLNLPELGYDTDDRLLEISFGSWEGMTWAGVKRDDREAYRARQSDGFNHQVPGGESYTMVMARVVSWFDDITAPTVVVSHGGIMRCLRGHVLKLSNSAILQLEVPQDKVMLIQDGSVRLL